MKLVVPKFCQYFPQLMPIKVVKMIGLMAQVEATADLLLSVCFSELGAVCGLPVHYVPPSIGIDRDVHFRAVAFSWAININSRGVVRKLFPSAFIVSGN